MAALADAIGRERLWRRVRATLVREDLATELPCIELVAAAHPNDLEAQLYAAWTRAHVVGDVTPGELEALARRVLDKHAALALPLTILGFAELRRGDAGAARRLFRRAIDADASLLEAVRGMRVAERRLASAAARRAATSARRRAARTIRFVAVSAVALTTLLCLFAHPG